jgi:tetratricopeptide (TPR) repeat protein
MWSGYLRARLGASLAVLSALGFGGCATSPDLPPWFSETMLAELRTQQEYTDFLTARYAGMVGDAASAAIYYRRAAENAPNDAGLLERAAFTTLAAGDVGEAIKLAKSAPKPAAEAAPSVQLALIADDIAQGRTRDALQRLKSGRLGAINADLAGFLTAWLAAGENADRGLETLAQLPPRRLLGGERETLRGVILMSAGRDALAADAFAKAQEMPLASPDIVAALSAQMLASKGDVAGARKAITVAAAEEDIGPAMAAMLADLDAGRKIAHPKLNGKQGAALALYLASAGGVGRSSPEVAVLRHALALHLDPQLAPARLALAAALVYQDRDDAALAVLRAVPATSPWAADALLDQADILDRTGKRADALAAADKALALSQRRDVTIRAADLHRYAGENERAVELYDRVVAQDGAGGADWRVLFARATSRNAVGDWPGAEADLMAAMTIEPNRAELQNFLGYGWVERGERVEEGLALIRRAAATRPDQGHIIDSLGWAYYRLGKYDEAVEQLERAAELLPTDAEILDHLGDAYWRVGRETEARYEWEAALELGPDPVREAALRGKLDRGLSAASAETFAARP